jgi:hypothetical protein
MSKKVRRQAIGVALFPFLAVLICTMGALIVLLVLLVQQASLDAQEIVKERARSQRPAVDPLAAERKVAQEKIEDEQWRQGILDQQRAGLVNELSDARLKVQHLADHIQRLQDQARTLMARAQEIDRGQEAKSPDLTADQAELAKLQAEIARRKADLEAKKKDLAKKDRSYALIPYDGPNGTKRRPIYIECSQRGVVLQPEGLILGPEDFSGPLNPGNPLDAALRAIRETWRRSGEPGEPYPLLVVRPDGIVAYQAARQALRGWDDEFGYELVDGEKRLDYGSPNPAMQQMLVQIVGSARQRQVMLAAAMPRKFQSDDTLTSFAPEDQPAFQEAISAARASGGLPNGNGEFSGGGSVAAGGYNSGGNGPGGLNGGTGQQGLGTGQGTGPNAQLVANRAGQGGSAFAGGQGTGNYAGNGGAGTAATANGATGNYPAGNGSTNVAGGTPGGNAASGGTSPGRNAVASGQAGGGQANSAQYGSAGQTSGAGQGSTGQQSGVASGGSPNSGGNPSSGAPSISATATKNNQARNAARQGSNWGLPGAQGRTTAVTRPIRVVCLPDKIVVVPERGDDRAASVIPVSAELQPAEVEAFVKAVQKHLDAWGPAMTNGYWKPVLQVEVSRAAEPQFETLQSLLQGSGFDLQRKNP